MNIQLILDNSWLIFLVILGVVCRLRERFISKRQAKQAAIDRARYAKTGFDSGKYGEIRSVSFSQSNGPYTGYDAGKGGQITTRDQK